MLLETSRPRREKGDTIVEVLIAIAVISVVMGGAFVMTNHSLQGSRDAQERLNATKLVESQIEYIKSLSASAPSSIFGATVPAAYCIAGGIVHVDTDDVCTVDVTGNKTLAQPSFHLTVSRSGNTFTVKDTWESVRGNTQNTVQMKYRVYQ